MVFVALAPLGTLAWKLKERNRETLEISQQENQHLLASFIAGRFDSRLDGLRGQLQAFADSLGGILADQGQAGLEHYLVSRPVLARLLDNDPDEEAVRIGGRDLVSLRVVSDSGRTWQARGEDWEASAEMEALLREEVSNAFSSPEGKARVGSPASVGSTGRAVVVLTVPVTEQGETRAVLAGLVDVSNLWAAILRKVRTPYTVYATDRQGRPFVHSNPAVLRAPSGLRETEIVQRFVSGGGRNSETLHFTAAVVPGGEPRSFIGAYDPTGQGWGIFVQAEEQYAFSLTQEMIRTTKWWSLGALAVAALLAFAFAGTLSVPVRRLTDAARRFAEGDYTVRAEVHGRDEIGELAETFNRMAGDIERTIREVKEKAKENHQLFIDTAEAFAEAIDAKDPYTRGHSVRVRRFSEVIARAMGLGDEAIEEIRVAALLHDVGKIGIDDAILKKPAGLTEEEYAIMKQHPAKGAKIFEKVGKRAASALDGMTHHHERWDGKGYPAGLKSEEIPLGARIISIADVYQALTSDRPYRKAFSKKEAMKILKDGAGTQFDPVIVKVFLDILKKENHGPSSRRG
jgi:putative nucleotidyltransferase with HDIG domain